MGRIHRFRESRNAAARKPTYGRNTGPGARFEAVAMCLHHSLRFAALALALGAGALASAQTPPAAGVPAPGAVERAPLPPPGGTAQPAPPAPAPPQTATPAPPPGGARPTLVPEPGDAGDVAEVTLPGKPAAVISGTSGADEGFVTIRNAVRKVEEELQKAGIFPAGRPVLDRHPVSRDRNLNSDALRFMGGAAE